jgi:hypothetical protein
MAFSEQAMLLEGTTSKGQITNETEQWANEYKK